MGTQSVADILRSTDMDLQFISTGMNVHRINNIRQKLIAAAKLLESEVDSNEIAELFASTIMNLAQYLQKASRLKGSTETEKQILSELLGNAVNSLEKLHGRLTDE